MYYNDKADLRSIFFQQAFGFPKVPCSGEDSGAKVHKEVKHNGKCY
jgi:hypothetical protein